MKSQWLNWARFMPSPLVEQMATLGPLGYLGKAPGTVGSVAGAGLFVVVFFHLDMFSYLLLCGLFMWFAIGICGEAEVRLQKRDPGEIILDEFVAMPWVFIGIPVAGLAQPWLAVLLGFILFRVFDIFKPLGIARLQNLPDGTGVVMDDIAAGLAACVCLHILWVSGLFV